MWTRGNKSNGFKVEVFDGNELVETLGPFDTSAEADRAGEAAQRRILFPQSAQPLDEIFAEMDDEELMKKLGL